jgi:AraC family transcriptional activator of tynA and feaB
MPNMALANYAMLSTRELPTGARLGRWNAFGSETLTDMTVDPLDHASFEARLSRRLIGGIGFVWMETNAAVARCRSSGVGTWGGKDALLLTVQDRGESAVDQRGRAGVLRPGDMVMRSGRGAWSTRVLGSMRSVTIKIPVHRLVTRFDDPERLAGHIIQGSSTSAKLAASLILSVRNSLDERPEDEWDAAIGDVVLDVVGLACRSQAAAVTREPAGNQRLLDEARRFIDRTLDDPLLCVASIAAAIGVSTRTVQRLFVEVGETPGSYVLARRLDRAAHMLTGTIGSTAVPITELAFSLGFNELSHFSRSFTKRFGVSPRTFRDRARA